VLFPESKFPSYRVFDNMVTLAINLLVQKALERPAKRSRAKAGLGRVMSRFERARPQEEPQGACPRPEAAGASLVGRHLLCATHET
jgi:hypothetical protein